MADVIFLGRESDLDWSDSSFRFDTPRPINQEPQIAISYAFGVSKDGDIGNVFNNGGPKGAAAFAVIEAMEQGGITLDAYGGYLPQYYSRFGFVETGRIDFDSQFAHSAWDYEKDGYPDVVFMRRSEILAEPLMIG